MAGCWCPGSPSCSTRGWTAGRRTPRWPPGCAAWRSTAACPSAPGCRRSGSSRPRCRSAVRRSAPPTTSCAARDICAAITAPAAGWPCRPPYRCDRTPTPRIAPTSSTSASPRSRRRRCWWTPSRTPRSPSGRCWPATACIRSASPSCVPRWPTTCPDAGCPPGRSRCWSPAVPCTAGTSCCGCSPGRGRGCWSSSRRTRRSSTPWPRIGCVRWRYR